MRIYLTSVLVDDQDKALRFYTDVLGFVTRTDIPLGEARWLTVASPDSPEGRSCCWSPTNTRTIRRTRRRPWPPTGAGPYQPVWRYGRV